MPGTSSPWWPDPYSSFSPPGGRTEKHDAKRLHSLGINETFPQFGRFAWQEGYGGFTVSKSMTPTVAAYIARQKEHHRTQDFKTELLELLRRHGIDFDEAVAFQ